MKNPHVWAAASVALYGAACVTPAVVFGDEGPLLGWHTLMWGWLPPYSIAWSANVFGLLAWFAYLFRLHVDAKRLGLKASAAAPATLLACWPGDLRVGFFLWLASFASLAWAAELACRREAAEDLANEALAASWPEISTDLVA